MKILAIDSFSAACAMAGRSRSSSMPWRRRCESTRASEVSMRMKSCSFDISRLNTPTTLPCSRAAFCAMLMTKDVLPIDGRAAMITRSLGCMPEVLRSRS